jgi:hypothetical protein
MKIEVAQFFINFTNTTFYENPSSGSRVVLWARTDVLTPNLMGFLPVCERF